MDLSFYCPTKWLSSKIVQSILSVMILKCTQSTSYPLCCSSAHSLHLIHSATQVHTVYILSTLLLKRTQSTSYPLCYSSAHSLHLIHCATQAHTVCILSTVLLKRTLCTCAHVQQVRVRRVAVLGCLVGG